MAKICLSAAHEDDRGVITDLLIGEEINAITSLTMRSGAVRGNHYHRETQQWTYVVSGEVTYAESPISGEKVLLPGLPGDLFLSEPWRVHAVRAEIASQIIVFTSGPRAGASYENDTVRVTDPIL